MSTPSARVPGPGSGCGAWVPALLLVVALSASAKGPAQGIDRRTGLQYAVAKPGEQTYSVELALPSGKRILASVDDAKHRIDVRVVAVATGSGPGLTAAEIDLLRDAGSRIKGPGDRAGDVLMSLIAWLSEAPPDRPIDVSTVGGDVELRAPAAP